MNGAEWVLVTRDEGEAGLNGGERRSTRCERCTYSEGFVHVLYRSKEQAYGGSCGGVQVPHHMSSLPDSCSTP